MGFNLFEPNGLLGGLNDPETLSSSFPPLLSN